MSRSLYAVLHQRHGRPTDGMTRREMLRATFAGAAGLLLTDHLAFGAQPARGRRVIVVGAGFAGLAAAHELAAAGYDVTVVEARNRIGGRVITFNDLVPGKHVEGGGELIGSNQPAWVSYKEKFKLGFLDVVEEEDFEFPIVLGGKRLTSAESEKLYEEMDAALNGGNADAAKVDADMPWKTPNAKALDTRTVAEWIDGLNVSPLCKSGLHAQLTADNGVDTAWQSYLGNLAQIKGGGLEKYWTDSEVFRCEGGNQQLARKLAAALPADRVMIKMPVRSIETSDRGVFVGLADGRRLEADEVILAVPPTVWNKIAIEPALPPNIQPQMGTNVKFLMACRSAFWRSAELAPDLLSDGPVQLTWETTSNQPGRSTVMVAFSGGSAADVTREWGAQRTAMYLKTLAPVYKGIGASFIRGRYMDWPGDVWVKGSYTFPAPGQITTIGSALHDGFGRLHFAGEHMNYAFIGYMEGGLGSGIAVAKRLAAKDGVIKEEAA